MSAAVGQAVTIDGQVYHTLAPAFECQCGKQVWQLIDLATRRNAFWCEEKFGAAPGHEDISDGLAFAITLDLAVSAGRHHMALPGPTMVGVLAGILGRLIGETAPDGRLEDAMNAMFSIQSMEAAKASAARRGMLSQGGQA